MKPRYREVKEAARYRWQEIHAAIGIAPKFLRNKHQPCPACGGKDRFRYDDKDGNGTFICSHWQNGAGDGFGLVMHFLACDFQTALGQVSGILGLSGANPLPIPATRPQPQSRPEKDRIGKLAALWNEAEPLTPDCPVVQYWASRGLSAAYLPENIRHHSSMEYWTQGEDGKPLFIGRFHAAIAASLRGGRLCGLHITYLEPAYSKPYGEDGIHAPIWQKARITHPQTGEALPAKKMRSRKQGAMTGGAVCLFPIPESGRLMVAEGIETALAARELFQARDWGLCAALSAHGMKRLELSDGIKELAIVADHDTPRPVGETAALSLAKCAQSIGTAVRYWISGTAGYDALDELNDRKRSGKE